MSLRNGVDPMTHQITPNPAVMYSFLPTAPTADVTGIVERTGTLHITMPEMANEKYYAILAMSHP